MSARRMCENVIESMDTAFDNFVPRRSYDLQKVEDLAPKYVEHPMVY